MLKENKENLSPFPFYPWEWTEEKASRWNYSGSTGFFIPLWGIFLAGGLIIAGIVLLFRL